MRSSSFLLIVLAVLMCSPVHAQYQGQQERPQERSSMALYLNAGLTNPVGPDAFDDFWNIGYNVGTGVALRLNRRLMVRPFLTYNSFSLNGSAVSDTIEVAPSVLEDGNYSTLTVSAELLVELEYNPFPVKPFFVIGGGYFRGKTNNLGDLQEHVDAGVRGSGEGRAAIRGGFGARAAFTDYLSVFGEVKVVTAFTGGFGVMYAPASLGAMVRF